MRNIAINCLRRSSCRSISSDCFNESVILLKSTNSSNSSHYEPVRQYQMPTATSFVAFRTINPLHLKTCIEIANDKCHDSET